MVVHQQEQGAVLQDTWSGLYRDGWQGLIVPEAFSHPAKFARGLIQHIYKHVREEGWLLPGQCVLDPFGGVSLGGLDAALHGYQHVAVELEAHFHRLAEANVALWAQRYAQLPQWRQPLCRQGDSRALSTVLQAADCLSASPPYADGCIHTTGQSATAIRQAARRMAPHRGTWGTNQGGDSLSAYSHNPANLGNLPPGDIAAVVSSPPYAAALSGSTNMDDADRAHRVAIGKNPDSAGSGYPRHYGDTPGNLATLPPGDIAAVVSSPPYASTLDHAHGNTQWTPERMPQRSDGTRMRPGQSMPSQYSDNPANLGNLAPDQLGNTHGTTFWEAARDILDQVYAILAPGAPAIWVTKQYVRNRALVDFPGDWRRLCEAVGFVTLHEHHALLSEEHGTQGDLWQGETRHRTKRTSFFRRLAEAKGSPEITHETVYCMIKPGLEFLAPDGDEVADVGLVMASPPYLDPRASSSRDDGHPLDARAGRSVERFNEYGTTAGQLGTMPPGTPPG